MKALTIAIVLVIIAPAIAAQQAIPNPSEQALLEAAFNGDLAAVEGLVGEGVSVATADGEQRTPLMFAAFNGHRHVAAFLLVEGAKVDVRDSAGRTALLYASSGPFVETVEVLLDAGAEVDTQGTLEGFTALMTAAAEGQLGVVRLLLDRGADASLQDVDGDTALSFAREKGHGEVIDLLEERSDPSIGDS